MTISTTDIQALYIAYFNRPADKVGLKFWTDAATAAGSVASVADAFAASDEFAETYSGTEPTARIIAIYNNLFGRDPEPEGLLFWSDALASGKVNFGNVAYQIFKGAQNADKIAVDSKAAAAAAFTESLDTTAEIGGYVGKAANAVVSTWLKGITNPTNLATATTPAALNAVAAAAVDAHSGTSNVGATYILTENVDAFVGTAGNDKFSATITASSSPIGGLDSIDGGAGIDSFSIADSLTAAGADLLFPTISITNVETLTVSTNGALGNFGGAEAFDISGTGVTTANLTAAGAGTGTGSWVVAANTTDVNLVVAGANKASVEGGKAVSVKAGTAAADVSVVGSGLTTVTVKGGGVASVDNQNAAGTTGAGSTLTSVILDGVKGATADLSGKALTNVTLKGIAQASDISISNTTTAGYTLDLTVAATGYDATGAGVVVKVTDSAAAGAGATKVNVTATSDSSIALVTAKATTITAAGAGALELDLTDATIATSFNASTSTGGVSLTNVAAGLVAITGGAGADSLTTTQIAKVTFDMGAGNDIVTVGTAIAAGSSIKLGAGNDALLDGGGSVAASGTTTATTTVIDGGAGVDTIAASLINAANAAQFINFEALDLSTAANLDVELVTGSTITALTLTGGAGGGTLSNVANTVGLSVSGLNTGISTIGVKGAGSAAADVFTITFNGDAHSSAPSSANTTAGNVVVNSIETVNIASNGAANTWNSIALTDSKLKVVNITGEHNLDVTFVGVNGTVASGAGGVSLIDGSTATGKLNIDTHNVTVDGAGLTVKGGTAADTIVLGGFAAVNGGAGNDNITTAAAGGTLTGGAGADTFNVAASVATAATAAGSVFTTITDLAATDIIKFGATVTAFEATKVALGSSVTNLDLALAAAVTTAGDVSWFQYGTNTYIVADSGVAPDGLFGAGDVVVRLTGLVDLSHSTLALGALTIA